jgi:four helix bundle protein
VLFASRVVRVAKALPRTEDGHHIAKQLIRCGTATSANYGEARAAESRADFIHKLRIVLKELNETGAWLELISERRYFQSGKMTSILNETRQLIYIIAPSINTARKQQS